MYWESGTRAEDVEAHDVCGEEEGLENVVGMDGGEYGRYREHCEQGYWED